MNKQLRDKLSNYVYYIVIAIASLVTVVFMPLVGSQIGIVWNLPNTTTGWVVYIATRIIIAGLNVLIFHSFMQQAKLNVKDNENYKKANEILGRVKIKEYKPRSPHSWNLSQYGKKGTTIFFTTCATLFAFSQAIIVYDWITLCTYLFTLTLGLVFGVMQMMKAQIYWTEEYLDYAKLIEKEQTNAD